MPVELGLEAADPYCSLPASPSTVVRAASPPTDDLVIEATNIHKTYLLGTDGVPALRGVSLAVRRGEFLVILGKSGGGKTSLLNVIGTIDRPSKGSLHICGDRITSTTNDVQFAQLRLRRIGFVFQTFNLISTMTAAENVALPMVLAGELSRGAIKERAHYLLSRVGMAGRVDHLPSQLSGGEQQRVTIARAIANAPDILLLDEPTGDLDSVNSHIVLQLLLELNRQENITCIMVTHDRNLKHFAHRVVHMMDGKILRIESISEAARTTADETLLSGVQHADRTARKLDPSTEYREEAFYGCAKRNLDTVNF